MKLDKPGKGVGARILRKEDARHLHGKGQFVSDIQIPGIIDVAFLMLTALLRVYKYLRSLKIKFFRQVTFPM